MKILLYGDLDPYYLGSSFLRAFEQLGHCVVKFDARALRAELAPWLRSRIGHRATIQSLALRTIGSKAWNTRLESVVLAQHPDLLLVLGGQFVMPGTLERIRRRGTRVFIFHPDSPFPGHPSARPEFLPSAFECDCYFIWSRVLAERLRLLGLRRVEYLPFAWDPEAFPHQAATNAEFDVVFIGGWDAEREDWLTKLAKHYDVRIWGPAYWRTRTARGSILRQCWRGEALHGTNATAVIAKARIVLNVLRSQHHVDGEPTGVIMRTFEVPGAGGFLLSTRSSEALEIFPEGKSGAYFSSFEECCAQIHHYLGHESDRRAIAAASHQVVATKHQYADRAMHIVDIFQSVES